MGWIGSRVDIGLDGFDPETKAYSSMILLSLCAGLRGKFQSRNRFENVLYLFHSAFDTLFLYTNSTYDQVNRGVMVDSICGKLIPVIYKRINSGWNCNSQHFWNRFPPGSRISWIFLHCSSVKAKHCSLVGNSGFLVAISMAQYKRAKSTVLLEPDWCHPSKQQPHDRKTRLLT